MPLIKDDHVVEILTSNGADHPFDKWILPRGARCGKDLLDPETVDASIEVRSVGLVSIPYQVPRRRVPWKSIDHLLRRPLGRRMFGDIEMNDPGLRRRLFQVQYRLNPQRCQRMTVSGFTMTRTLSQSVQILRNSTQNSRSTFESRGRFTERRRTASCCRRATFSRASSRRAFEGRDESANQRRNHAGMVLADRRLIKFGARG